METAQKPQMAIQAKQYLEDAKDGFLHTFKYVPDDKLNWSPSDTAKSSIQIAAHLAVSTKHMASIVRKEKMPDMAFDQMMEMAKQEEAKITTREEAIRQVKEGAAEFAAALDNLTQEDIESTVETPFYTAPMPFWMYLGGRHFDMHRSQVDYIQTIWGDLDSHMGDE